MDHNIQAHHKVYHRSANQLQIIRLPITHLPQHRKHHWKPYARRWDHLHLNSIINDLTYVEVSQTN